MPKDTGKRKDRDKDRDKNRPKKSRVATTAETMGAQSMGPVASRAALPSTREELMELWLEARRRRQAAPLGSDAYVQASEDVARIEVEIAAIERALTPPLV
jgi:hypothetical protein